LKNDSKTAKYYDITSQISKGQEIIDEELLLIKKIFKKDSIVLDLGCGTGRHLIPLFNENYFNQLIGLDITKEHLELLRKKSSKFNSKDLLNVDFNNYDFGEQKFDGIYLFWNALNEICLTDKSLNEFLEKCISILSPKGKILINIDDIKTFNVDELNFEYELEKNDLGLKNYQFKVIKFNSEKNLSISEESFFTDKEIFRSEITQRWWTLDDILKEANSLGLALKQEKITSNNELYIVLSK